MKCPNCGNEMIDNYRLIWDEIDWDEPCYELIEERCGICGIKHNENAILCEKEEWELPSNLRPTEKQIRTKLFILNRLGYEDFKNNEDELDFFQEPITKKQYIDFIGKYFDKAKKTQKKDCYTGFEDDLMWVFPEMY